MQLVKRKAIFVDMRCVEKRFESGFDRYWKTLRSSARLEESLCSADSDVNTEGPPADRPHRLVWSWLTHPERHPELEHSKIAIQVRNELDELQCRIDSSYFTGDFVFFAQRWFEHGFFIALFCSDLSSQQMNQMLDVSNLSKFVHTHALREESRASSLNTYAKNVGIDLSRSFLVCKSADIDNSAYDGLNTTLLAIDRSIQRPSELRGGVPVVPGLEWLNLWASDSHASEKRVGPKYSTHVYDEVSDEVSNICNWGGRLLGLEPKSGCHVRAFNGELGPYVALTTIDGARTVRSVFLRPGQTILSATLESAVEVLEMRGNLGNSPDERPVSVGVSRYLGPFISIGGETLHLDPEVDLTSLDRAGAIQLFEETKAKSDASKRARKRARRKETTKQVVAEFADERIQVAIGRFGPFVTDGNVNARVPTGREPSLLTVDECKELLSTVEAKRKKRIESRKKL